MKLLSPVNSFLSAKAHIENGADEIYVGLQTDSYKSYSFSGRGQNSTKYASICPSAEELKQITDFAHENKVAVNLAANISCFSNYAVGDTNIETEYIRHVEKGVECGVDNIIVGDIGLIYKLSKLNLPVHLHASVFLDTMNVEQLLFLKELGVSRAVLTHQIHITEIERLCQSNIMEIEVFGYLSCSFFNGSCNMTHDRGELSKDETSLLGIPCKAAFDISGGSIDKKDYPFFDAELGCALCSIAKLNKMGVNVIKISGRERDYKTMLRVTSLFRKALDLTGKFDGLKYQDEVKKLVYIWWKRFWCQQNRCKYTNNDVTNSYIGINK